MGWGRYSTEAIERLMVIALTAVVIGLTLPTYVRLARSFEGWGYELVWYHHIGLFALCTLAAILALGLLALLGGAVIWLVLRRSDW